MLYAMGGLDAATSMADYAAHNRSIWVQELNLTPAQRADLRDFLVWNARPENRNYRYNYYLDNCSTRVRDALDRVLGGRIRAATDTVPAGTTFRFHTARLTTNDPLMFTGLMLGLGEPVDRPISRYEEMFLPLALREHIRSISVPWSGRRRGAAGAVGADGLPEHGTASPAAPPFWLPAYLLIGGVLGGVFWYAGTHLDRSAGARAALAVTGGLWSLLAGLSGVILAGLWLLTDHSAAYRNENLFQFSPLALPLVVLLPLAAYGRGTVRPGASCGADTRGAARGSFRRRHPVQAGTGHAAGKRHADRARAAGQPRAVARPQGRPGAGLTSSVRISHGLSRSSSRVTGAPAAAVGSSSRFASCTADGAANRSTATPARPSLSTSRITSALPSSARFSAPSGRSPPSSRDGRGRSGPAGMLIEIDDPERIVERIRRVTDGRIAPVAGVGNDAVGEVVRPLVADGIGHRWGAKQRQPERIAQGVKAVLGIVDDGHAEAAGRGVDPAMHRHLEAGAVATRPRHRRPGNHAVGDLACHRIGVKWKHERHLEQLMLDVPRYRGLDVEAGHRIAEHVALLDRHAVVGAADGDRLLSAAATTRLDGADDDALIERVRRPFR